MKYSPKKFDTKIRAVYSISLIIALGLMMLPAKGFASTLLSSVALLLIGVSIMLFVKYDATRYEYILMERNGTLDFYVNKISGRRSAYAVYFPLTDCAEIGRFGESTRGELNARYQGCRITKYVQNFLSSKDIHYALFKAEYGYECVVFEPDTAFVTLMKEYLGKPPCITFDNGEELAGVEPSDENKE